MPRNGQRPNDNFHWLPDRRRSLQRFADRRRSQWLPPHFVHGIHAGIGLDGQRCSGGLHASQGHANQTARGMARDSGGGRPSGPPNPFGTPRLVRRIVQGSGFHLSQKRQCCRDARPGDGGSRRNRGHSRCGSPCDRQPRRAFLSGGCGEHIRTSGGSSIQDESTDICDRRPVGRKGRSKALLSRCRRIIDDGMKRSVRTIRSTHGIPSIIEY
mmetsp:Transcript_15277/g.32882  ORF Transcript_15277/g.32882 Transcript_15277/m.32882 type:complete len:213 (+) Transcript_15277:484-1122(+)